MTWSMDERFEELKVSSYLATIYAGRRYSPGCLCPVGSTATHRSPSVASPCYCTLLLSLLFGGGSSKLSYGCH